jgi:hypothetical protein
MDDAVRTFEEAAEGLEGDEALDAMANAYSNLIAERPELLLMQMQTYVTVAAAEQDGYHEFGEEVRSGWMRLWDTVHLPLGADIDETTNFLAYGVLINSLVAMGFVPEPRLREGLHPLTRLRRRHQTSLDNY